MFAAVVADGGCGNRWWQLSLGMVLAVLLVVAGVVLL